MRWPLRIQLLVPLVTITVAAVSLVSGLAAWSAARRAEHQMDAQLDALAATLRSPSFPQTDPVLTQVRGLSGVEIVRLDAGGQITATSLSARRRDQFRRPDASHQVRGAIVELDGERYFDRVVPEVERSGARPGEVHLLYSEREWHAGRREAVTGALLAGTFVLALAVIAAVTTANRLSRPIAGLRTQVGRIADGQYDPLPLPHRDDELRDLAASVNRLAERLTEMTEGLRRGERLALLGQLSGGLAHQLRNSIAGAKMAVQLHQRNCAGGDPQSVAVALRQLALTEEHLQSFLTAGQPRPPQRTPCDVRQLLAEIRMLVEPMARHRQVELRWEDANDDLSLLVDVGQLRELVLNLLLNAIDAAGVGGWVGVSVRRSPAAAASNGQSAHGADLVISVTDSGPGPPKDICDRMFEPLVTGKPEGIGLGLAVAQRIAEAHGGRIEFHRQAATCFTVTLPVADDEAEHESTGS